MKPAFVKLYDGRYWDGVELHDTQPTIPFSSMTAALQAAKNKEFSCQVLTGKTAFPGGYFVICSDLA
jgi:hypothetical protein